LLEKLFEKISDVFNDLGEKFDELFQFFDNLLRELAKFFKDLLKELLNYLSDNLLEKLENELRNLIKKMLNDKKVKKKLMEMINKLIYDLLKEEPEKPFIDFKLVLKYETKDVEQNEKIYLLIITNLSLNASYNASSNASDDVVINLLSNSNLFFIILILLKGSSFIRPHSYSSFILLKVPFLPNNCRLHRDYDRDRANRIFVRIIFELEIFDLEFY